jgi:cytochrome c5
MMKNMNMRVRWKWHGVALTVALPLLAVSLAQAKETPDGAVDPEILKRIEPVGKVEISKQAAAAPEKEAAAPPAGAGAQGKTTYETVCVACHGSGIAGAPKVGDKAAWANRISQGMDKLYEHAIKGFQGKSGMMMPPKGGSDRPDADIKAAVDYMVGQSK